MGYTLDDMGIYRPSITVNHRNNEYDETSFVHLMEMQANHFWYKGRHKFLLTALKKTALNNNSSVIDLGGGVGGWVKYLFENKSIKFTEIAMGDSSEIALLNAKTILPESIGLYQVDLMTLEWKDKWDIIFLLDVIEHCPDDVSILRQAFNALKPGGKLIVSTPALMVFWSYNDEKAQHLRRYNRADYKKLADKTGFNLVDARYFMFFLSPLYWLSRKTKSKNLTDAELDAAIIKEHQPPNKFLNRILTAIFSAESPLGHFIHFPWGTSVLGIFEKPTNCSGAE